MRALRFKILSNYTPPIQTHVCKITKPLMRKRGIQIFRMAVFTILNIFGSELCSQAQNLSQVELLEPENGAMYSSQAEPEVYNQTALFKVLSEVI